jgi:hypothetical protein
MNTHTKPSESEAHATTVTRWFKRLGFAGFAFFLLKGMMWLLVPWLAHTAIF